MIAKKYSDFKGHIPNRIIEAMFLDVATKDQRETFLKQVEVGFGPATAYVSKVILDWWEFFTENPITTNFSEAKIKNTTLERMFMDIASTEETKKFIELTLLNQGLATSYVSRIVYGWWKWFLLERGELENE